MKTIGCASVGALIFFMVAAPARSETLVVLNKAEATASVFDLAAGRAVASLATGTGPHEAATSPDGRQVLATNYGNREAPGSSLTLIDVESGQVVRSIEVGEGTRPHGVVWLPDGKRALVTAEGTKSLLIVDVEKGAVESSILTDQEAAHMVVAAPDGSRAFVANIGSGNITVVDVPTFSVIQHVETGKGAEGIDITPNGAEVWVSNREADTVSIVDARTLQVVKTLPAASFPIRVRITPDGKHALVSAARSAELIVYDVAARKELRRLELKLDHVVTEGRLFGDQFGKSSVPIGVVVTPDGDRAFVAHAGSDAVSIVDLTSWKVIGALATGKEPDGMAYSRRSVKRAEIQ